MPVQHRRDHVLQQGQQGPFLGLDMEALLKNPDSVFARDYQAACEEAAVDAFLLTEEQRLNYLAAIKQRASEDRAYQEDLRYADEKSKKLMQQLAEANRKRFAVVKDETVQNQSQDNKVKQQIAEQLYQLAVQAGSALQASRAKVADAYEAVKAAEETASAADVAFHEAADACRDKVASKTYAITAPDGSVHAVALSKEELDKLAEESATAAPTVTPLGILEKLPEGHAAKQLHIEQYQAAKQQKLAAGMDLVEAEVNAKSDALESMYPQFDIAQVMRHVVPVATHMHSHIQASKENHDWDALREYKRGQLIRFIELQTMLEREALKHMSRTRDFSFIQQMVLIVKLEEAIEEDMVYKQKHDDAIETLVRFCMQPQNQNTNAFSFGNKKNGRHHASLFGGTSAPPAIEDKKENHRQVVKFTKS